MFFGVLICSIFMFTRARWMPQDTANSPWGIVTAAQFFRADAFWACAVQILLANFFFEFKFRSKIWFLFFKRFSAFLWLCFTLRRLSIWLSRYWLNSLVKNQLKRNNFNKGRPIILAIMDIKF